MQYHTCFRHWASCTIRIRCRLSSFTPLPPPSLHWASSFTLYDSVSSKTLSQVRSGVCNFRMSRSISFNSQFDNRRPHMQFASVVVSSISKTQFTKWWSKRQESDTRMTMKCEELLLCVFWLQLINSLFSKNQVQRVIKKPQLLQFVGIFECSFVWCVMWGDF